MGRPESLNRELPVLTETVAIQLKLAIQWCQAQHESLSVTSLVDCCERFNIWASGIGALHDSNNQLSLAHRLRKAPGLASLFCDLLNDILDDLRQLYPPNALHDLPLNTPVAANDRLPPSHEGLDSKSLDRCLHGVEDTLVSLFKASRATKQAAKRDRFQTALSKTSPDEGGNGDEHCIKLGEMFPRLRDPRLSLLRTRLGTTCNTRNRYLLYRERHHQTVSAGGPALKVGTETMGEHTFGEADARSTASTAEPTGMEELSIALQDTASVVSGSVLSYLTQTGKNLRFKVLDLQQVSRGRSGFLCPYCRDEQLLDTSKSPREQQKRWEKHVFADLRAYMCPDELCSSQLFEDSHAWLRHQLSVHLKEWRCRVCNTDGTFNTFRDLKQHYISQHRLVDEDDKFHKLSQASEVSPRTIPATSCKFCDWSEYLPKGSDRVPTSRYRRHVGVHLEQIALSMVPEQYRMLNDTDDDDDIDDTNDDPSVDEAEHTRRRHKEAKRLIVHLLAVRPTSTEDIIRVTQIQESELSGVIEGMAQHIDGKWKLLDRVYRDLTVWEFPYETQEDRQMAIDCAIRAYDRIRVGREDNLWQLLLPEEERGKGKLLSKLHLSAPVSERESAPASGHMLGSLPNASDDGERAKTAVASTAAVQPRASSYWSVPEQHDFVKCIGHFGTDFVAIAAHMGTKTQIMVRNHYQRQIDGGHRADLEEAALLANVRRERGEDMGAPPTATPIRRSEKGKVEHTPQKPVTSDTKKTQQQQQHSPSTPSHLGAADERSSLKRGISPPVRRMA